MWRYIRTITICFFDILFAYFGWMIPFSRHPERWPLEYRYTKVRRLTLKIVKHLHVDYHVTNGHYFNDGNTYLFVANHHSMFDALITMCLSERPVLFVGKHEILKFPFFGRIMKGIDCVFIERDNLRKEIAVLKTVKQSLSERATSWIIFPEGTRNKKPRGSLLPFKAGTFKLALDTKTPVVPIALYGTFRALNRKYHLQRFPVQVLLLEPITPEEYEHMNTVQLAELVRARLAAEIDKLRVTDTQLIPARQVKKEND